MNHCLARLAPLALLAGLYTSAPALAQKNSADVVKATATADKPDANGKQTVTITLAITRPWHIYANPVGNKDLLDTQTTASVTAAGKPTKANVAFPPGKLQKDDVVGNYKIYEDTVTIKATVVRAKDDTGPLAVELKFHACNANTCLMPGKVKLDVK